MHVVTKGIHTFTACIAGSFRLCFLAVWYIILYMYIFFADVMSYSGYTPLDVATATIKGNQELVLALEESHLEHVVQLLVVMTTNPRGSSEGSSMDGRSEVGGGLGVIHRISFSFNYEWSPQAGQKCLEFLHAAVWVDGKLLSANVPYSGKLSRGKTFTNLVILEPPAKVFSTKFGLAVPMDL